MFVFVLNVRICICICVFGICICVFAFVFDHDYVLFWFIFDENPFLRIMLALYGYLASELVRTEKPPKLFLRVPNPGFFMWDLSKIGKTAKTNTHKITLLS